jgi:hypothetical protein
VVQVLKDSLGVEDVEEVSGVVSVPVQMQRQNVHGIEANWVVNCARGSRFGLEPGLLPIFWST